LLFNKFFFRLSTHALVPKIWPDKGCAMVPKWRFFASCISSEPRADSVANRELQHFLPKPNAISKGHAGSKTLLQQNRPVVCWECQLYNECKMVVCMVFYYIQQAHHHLQLHEPTDRILTTTYLLNTLSCTFKTKPRNITCSKSGKQLASDLPVTYGAMSVCSV